MYLPRGKGTQLFRLLHVVKKGQHLPELVHSVGRHAFGAVFRVEPFEALMDDIPYLHRTECSLLPNTCQSGLQLRPKKEAVVESSKPLYLKISWLRGADLNRRPLGYAI